MRGEQITMGRLYTTLKKPLYTTFHFLVHLAAFFTVHHGHQSQLGSWPCGWMSATALLPRSTFPMTSPGRSSTKIVTNWHLTCNAN